LSQTNPATPDHRPGTEAKPAVSSVGRQLRGMRQRRRWTLQDLANGTGLSVGMLSQIERGLSSPSIRTLQRLAEAFGVPIGWFFTEPPAGTDGPAWVQRRPQRRVLDLPGKGITKELLTPAQDGMLELMLVTVEPGGSSGVTPYTHVGEDAGLVLEGSLLLEVAGDACVLRAGDAFRFPSTSPHRFENPGQTRSLVLWAVTPPLY
jgi:transcriptional regulator with XRE-family HTH domain